MSDRHRLVRARAVDGVGTLVLDSPQNRNALSAGLRTQLFAGLERFETHQADETLLAHRRSESGVSNR